MQTGKRADPFKDKKGIEIAEKEGCACGKKIEKKAVAKIEEKLHANKRKNHPFCPKRDEEKEGEHSIWIEEWPGDEKDIDRAGGAWERERGVGEVQEEVGDESDKNSSSKVEGNKISFSPLQVDGSANFPQNIEIKKES